MASGAPAPLTARSRTTLAAIALVIVFVYAALQLWWFPPDGFFTGDQGTKFLQARAVLQHGVFHPWIDGPALAIDTTHRWQEPFLLHRDGHLVGVFPWLLSVLTAPFLALGGLRGLYAVPALSIAIVFLASCRIGRQLDQPAAGVWSGLCAVLATPLLFYGAELWEHAPAVALSTIAGTLMMEDGSRAWARSLVAGVLLVLAASLRPEALAVAPAFLIAIASSGRRAPPEGRGYASWPLVLGLAAGVALAGGVMALVNHTVYGSAIPQHVSSNLEVNYPYWGVRRDAVVQLLLPIWHRKVFLLGGAILVIGAFSRTHQTRLRAAHIAIVVMLGVAIAVPLWRTWVGNLPWLATFGANAVAHTWPFLYVLGYQLVFRDRMPEAERALWIATGIIFGLVFLTMPHVGGAQWSARFFLPAAPFAAVLAIQVIGRARRELPRSLFVRAVAALAIAASVGVQIYGVVLLKQFKDINARITAMTARLTHPDDVIVSDLFWFPEVTATLYPTRRLLFAWSPADVGAVAARAAEVGAPRLWVVTSTGPAGYAPPPSFADGDRRVVYVHTSRMDPGVSSLSFHRYSRP